MLSFFAIECQGFLSLRDFRNILSSHEMNSNSAPLKKESRHTFHSCVLKVAQDICDTLLEPVKYFNAIYPFLSAISIVAASYISTLQLLTVFLCGNIKKDCKISVHKHWYTIFRRFPCAVKFTNFRCIGYKYNEATFSSLFDLSRYTSRPPIHGWSHYYAESSTKRPNYYWTWFSLRCNACTLAKVCVRRTT